MTPKQEGTRRTVDIRLERHCAEESVALLRSCPDFMPSSNKLLLRMEGGAPAPSAQHDQGNTRSIGAPGFGDLAGSRNEDFVQRCGCLGIDGLRGLCIILWLKNGSFSAEDER